MSQQTTAWYAPEQTPVHLGVYQLHNLSTNGLFYSNWTEDGWSIGCLCPEEAAKFTVRSVVQNRWPWRGLTGKSFYDACRSLRVAT